MSKYNSIAEAIAAYGGHRPPIGIFTFPSPVIAGDFIYELLMDSGSPSMRVDGSETPRQFEYQTPAGWVALIADSAVQIINISQRQTKFGGLNALDNGLKVEGIDSDGTTVFKDYLDGSPIKKNGDFTRLTCKENPVHAEPLDDFFQVAWCMKVSGATPMFLPGQRLRVTVQDDLTAITEMNWVVQGVLIEEQTMLELMRL